MVFFILPVAQRAMPSRGLRIVSWYAAFFNLFCREVLKVTINVPHCWRCRLFRDGCLNTWPTFASRLLRDSGQCILLLLLPLLLLLLLPLWGLMVFFILPVAQRAMPSRGLRIVSCYAAFFFNLFCREVLKVTINVPHTVQQLPCDLATLNLLHDCVKHNTVHCSPDLRPHKGVTLLFFCWQIL